MSRKEMRYTKTILFPLVMACGVLLMLAQCRKNGTSVHNEQGDTLAMRYARSLAVDENNPELTDEQKAAQKQAQLEAFKQADQIYADLIEKFPTVKAYGLYQRGMVNSNIDADMTQGLAKPYFEEVINLLTQEEELDAQGKRYLETSYRYLMSYNYQVMKDNKAALECAQKILEIKPDDEGIKQVVETLSKAVK